MLIAGAMKAQSKLAPVAIAIAALLITYGGIAYIMCINLGGTQQQAAGTARTTLALQLAAYLSVYVAECSALNNPMPCLRPA